MPDFTMLLKSQTDEKYNHLKDKVLVVPNKKIITTSKLSNIEELYTNMLKEIILSLKTKGLEAVFLIHEGIGDYQVAKIVNTKLPNPIEIVWEKDIYKLKGIISGGKALVGSRFHSLVSSLSQAVPSIAIGWSHKYQMLFKDFNSEKNIFKLDDKKEIYLNKLNKFFTDNELLSERQNLLNQSLVQKQKIDAMWKIIFEEII
jgi:colanic acid/amylovoran biosynthesis protein